jgi:ribonucleoside-diphosphate reductase alpha chain
VTAHDVTPEWHIRMQAAFQEYTDSAISKTCNFPNAATEEDVEQIYRLAFQLNCKGVTVYRDGAREMQVLSTGTTAKKVQAGSEPEEGAGALADALGRIAELEAELARTKELLHGVEAENLQRRAKRSRPDLLRGTTRRLETPLGTIYVTITEDDLGQPFEVFMSLGKAGAPIMADVEAIGRLISLALRSGIPMKEIYRQLRGISSDRVIGLGPNKILSVPDAVGIAIERWMQEKQGIQQELLPGAPPADAESAPVVSRVTMAGGEQMMLGGMQETFSGACPDCGSQLEFAEGCIKCHVCGFSECG